VDGEGISKAADAKSGRPRPALGSGPSTARGRWIWSASGIIAGLAVLAMGLSFAAAVAVYGFA